jgi:hypothetical protein
VVRGAKFSMCAKLQAEPKNMQIARLFSFAINIVYLFEEIEAGTSRLTEHKLLMLFPCSS